MKAILRVRPGLTLLEVVVAIAVGGMVVSGAVGLVLGLTGRAEAVAARAAAVDAEANGERLLRALVRNVDAGDGTERPVRGTARRAQFRSWCQTPGGTVELCAVSLVVDQSSDRGRVTVRVHTPDTVERSAWSDPVELRVRDGFEDGRLLYLFDAARGGEWRDGWSHLVMPAALAVVMDEDTLILPLR